MTRFEIIKVKNGYIVRPVETVQMGYCIDNNYYVYATIEDVAKALPELVKEGQSPKVTENYA